jgi:hypothetical protein
MNRQKQILAVTLILLLLAVVWSYYNWPRQKSVAVLKYAPGQQPTTAITSDRPAAADDGRVLNMALLDKESSPFKGYHRNIFRPLVMDEMAASRQKAVVSKPQPLPLPPPLPPPALPPRRELARFTFLGFLQTAGSKIVFLGKDKEVLLVKAGDTFAGIYKAAQITDRVLTIKVIDGDEEIIVPLVDNRPLGANR